MLTPGYHTFSFICWEKIILFFSSLCPYPALPSELHVSEKHTNSSHASFAAAGNKLQGQKWTLGCVGGNTIKCRITFSTPFAGNVCSGVGFLCFSLFVGVFWWFCFHLVGLLVGWFWGFYLSDAFKEKLVFGAEYTPREQWQKLRFQFTTLAWARKFCEDNPKLFCASTT